MESQEKKGPPVYERSIMLTRFKLSQQKRELNEQNPSTKALKSPKTTKKQKSQIKNKEKPKRNVKDEFHPNKLKRKKIVNKIVLKPKNDLKIINWNDVKRKRLASNTKPFNIKRKKTNKSTNDVNEGMSSPDSDVSFDEVIRRADDELDDEGLMEILTCPSPVWWEEPPDGNHMEGPIIIQTNTFALPDVAPSCRRKKSRKRTPHKIVQEECKTNDLIVENHLQNNLTNKTTDVKFNKKRNKLENLLSTMKNKLKNAENSTKDIKKDDTSEDKQEDSEVKPEIADLSGDSTYLDISLFDNDILKHLENIKIPIEDIEQAKSKKQTNPPKRKHYRHKVFYRKKSKTSQKPQIEKSQTENLNIVDIGNLKINLEALKHIKNLKIGIPREKIRNVNEISTVTKKNSSKKSLKTDNEMKNNDLSNNEMQLKINDDVLTTETNNFEKSLKTGNNEIKNNDVLTNETSNFEKSLKTGNNEMKNNDLSNNEMQLKMNDDVLPNETNNSEKSLEIENPKRENNDVSDNDMSLKIKDDVLTNETNNFEKSLKTGNNEMKNNDLSNNEMSLKINDDPTNVTNNFEKSLEIGNPKRENNYLSDKIPFNIKGEIITIEEGNFKKSLENGNDATNDFSNNEIPFKIKEEVITNDNEEYVTVFEIINSDDEIAKNPETKSYIKTEIPSIEETDQSKLNTYYKKCKKSMKDTKKYQNKSNKLKNKLEDSKICLNSDTKNSKIVPSTTDIKYCLKCSSIFDADICSYCIKREEKQQETI